MATIKDVAARAGVAPSTVSYVLSGSRKISEDTRHAVQAAIEELGYHPRASARTLRSARTRVLALAAPRVPGAYRAIDGRFAIDVTDAARGHGYDVLLMTDSDGVGGLRRVARSRLADAAVLMAVEDRDPRVEVLHELGFPAALLGHDDHAALPWTDLDWEAAVALAVRESVAAGHRRMLFLSSAEHEVAARRGYALHGLDGARRAAAETGADVRVVPSHRDPDILARRLNEALTARPVPTALIVQHLILLPRLLDTVAAAGLRVPHHLTVVLVGSLPDELGTRHLPRIDLPVAEMSTAVARLAIDAIGSGRDDGPPSSQEPAGAGASTRPSDAPHHLIQPQMAGPVIAPPPGRP
ncbi:transcriptional regulator [Streptomyces viridochromogenes DSM 40736]|uniref:Transcriptional regulator n=1 Tax=Streptomyces viridochromogenes (strain DSM 40736 / JCM 4977 / BCRC 1201 / Tue 494) TaxID=591159 RepID=D9XHR0_STRVT|nr:LacI family DNA-binding transcriptional regulator [Streptomyces viridochromogenes]EFL37089.1 transcriptional regulator [Streptomyces viridochromogenes DSM 40736]